MARDHKLTKSIGEHFTCAALAQEGWAASSRAAASPALMPWRCTRSRGG